MKRWELALVIGLVCSILLHAFSGFAQQCNAVRQEVVRLHIRANSDTEEDQQLKLAVRDAVLEETEDWFAAADSKQQAEITAQAGLEQIQAVAEAEVARQGYAYPVRVRLVNRYFETKVYDNFTMPAGRYDAVQIEIGSGEGKNWWCVMYPPMCIPAAADARETTSLEEQILELGESPQYQPAFAAVEMLEAFWQRLTGQMEQENPLC